MSSEQKTKVLIVDDEKMLLQLYRAKFEQSGYDVYTCTEADDALKVLRYGYKPDVILFDINMPGMSGYDFLKTVKAEKLGAKHNVAIALTNQGHDAERQYTDELGADAHLLKAAFTPAEVVVEVERIMEKGGVEKR